MTDAADARARGADTSAGNVERVAGDLENRVEPVYGGHGTVMEHLDPLFSDAAALLRALLARAVQAEAERDAARDDAEFWRKSAGNHEFNATRGAELWRAAEAERDAARAEAQRMREALGRVVEHRDATSEIHTSADECADCMAAIARAALSPSAEPQA